MYALTYAPLHTHTPTAEFHSLDVIHWSVIDLSLSTIIMIHYLIVLFIYTCDFCCMLQSCDFCCIVLT